MTEARQEAPVRSWSRVDGIDLLRGLAIFFVLMNHVNMQLLFAHVPYTRGLPKQLVASLVWNGQQGVQIFFAVSGFLITSTSLRRWKSLAHVSVADFYRLRFARIAPLLVGLLAILSVLHLAHVPHFVVRPETGGLGRALVAALTFHVNLLEATRGYLPGSWDILWSLSVEETFYFAFPWMCRLFGRGQADDHVAADLRVAGALRALGAGAWQSGLAGVFLSRRHGCDCDGMPDGHRAPRAHAIACVAAAAGRCGRRAAGLLPCFFAHSVCMATGAHGTLHERRWLGASMLIAVAAQTGWRSPRVFLPLLMAGRRSYEIYLTHMFVVIAMAAGFAVLGRAMWAVPVFFVAVIVVSGFLVRWWRGFIRSRRTDGCAADGMRGRLRWDPWSRRMKRLRDERRYVDRAWRRRAS